jgi:hypothetical protein
MSELFVNEQRSSVSSRIPVNSAMLRISFSPRVACVFDAYAQSPDRIILLPAFRNKFVEALPKEQAEDAVSSCDARWRCDHVELTQGRSKQYVPSPMRPRSFRFMHYAFVFDMLALVFPPQSV